MPITARSLSTADFIANHTPAEPSAPIGKITFRRDARQMACYKKGPSAKLGPDGDSGGHGAPSVAIQTDQTNFIGTYRALRLRFKVALRLRFKVKERQHLQAAAHYRITCFPPTCSAQQISLAARGGLAPSSLTSHAYSTLRLLDRDRVASERIA